MIPSLILESGAEGVAPCVYEACQGLFAFSLSSAMLKAMIFFRSVLLFRSPTTFNCHHHTFFSPQKYHMLLSLNLNFNYFALFFYFLNGWDLIMAALQQLRGCSSAWSALSWLPWLNKCATTDLVSLVINRIHLFFFHPAVEYSKGPSYPVALSCSWHPILNYDPLINARNNPNLHIVAKWKQSVRFHWKIVFLITALHFREICLYLSL